MKTLRKIKEGMVYPGRAFELSEYDHYLCCYSGSLYVVDAIPCDKDGNYQPGFNCGVPTRTEYFIISRGFYLDER